MGSIHTSLEITPNTQSNETANFTTSHTSFKLQGILKRVVRFTLTLFTSLPVALLGLPTWGCKQCHTTVVPIQKVKDRSRRVLLRFSASGSYASKNP